MIGSILGKKLGMTSLFDENGNVIQVSVIEAGPVVVIQVKTPDRDGYAAVQIGFGEKKLQRATKAEIGHAKKAETSPRKVLREVKVPAEEIGDYKPGQVISLSDLGFEKGDYVDVTGTSIGKGYAGVIKRHGFSGYGKTHGTHEYLRHGGSIGTTATPGRVLKGKKMAGQMGNVRVTTQNLMVAEVRPEENLIMIRGSVPGHKNGVVAVRRAKKKSKSSEGKAA